MANRFVNPSNAFKQAKEFIEIKDYKAALIILHDVLKNKRLTARHFPSFQLYEDIMYTFLNVCVLLRDYHSAKDGLHQFKNNARQIMSKGYRLALENAEDGKTPFEKVVLHYLTSSEEATLKARTEADRLIAALANGDVKAVEAAAEANSLAAAGSMLKFGKSVIAGDDQERGDEDDDGDQDDSSPSLLKDSPESSQLTSVSGEGPEGRIERVLLNPWLRFSWESYRNLIDLLRTKGKLEHLYSMVVERCFAFCIRYKRRTEFRKLTEMMRIHYGILVKYSHANNTYESKNGTKPVSLKDPLTQQRQLRLRLLQFRTAIVMGMYQEAFRTVEDASLAFRHCSEPSNFLLREYYSLMADLFTYAENSVFHAHCALEYANLVLAGYQKQQEVTSQQQKSKDKDTTATDSTTEETDQENKENAEQGEKKDEASAAAAMTPLSSPSVIDADQVRASASRAFLAIMSIPPPRSKQDAIQLGLENSKSARLASMMRLPTVPTRESLSAALFSHSTLCNYIDARVAGLRAVLERFHPLALANESQVILNVVAGCDDYKIYHRPLQIVRVVRLLQQLGRVYRCIRLENSQQMVRVEQVPALCKFTHSQSQLALHTEPQARGEVVLEQFLVRLVNEGYCDVQIDMFRKVLIFEERTLSRASSKVQLSSLSQSLHQVIERIRPEIREARAARKAAAFRSAAQSAEEERKMILKRKAEIERRKEQEEAEELKRRQKEEAEQRAAAAEAERQREEELKRRQEEEEKAYQETMAAKEAEKKENLPDAAQLMQEKVDKLRVERSRAERKLRKLEQTVQVLVRARREREHPLLVTKLEKEAADAAAHYESQSAAREKKHRELHQRQLEEKARLERLVGFRDKYLADLEARRRKQHETGTKQYHKRQDQISDQLDRLEEEFEKRQEELPELEDAAQEEERLEHEQRMSQLVEKDRIRSAAAAAGGSRKGGMDYDAGPDPTPSEDRGSWSSNHDRGWGPSSRGGEKGRW